MDTNQIALDNINARINGIGNLCDTLISADDNDDAACAALANDDARWLALGIISAWCDIHKLVGPYTEAVVAHVARFAAIEARADRYKLAQVADATTKE